MNRLMVLGVCVMGVAGIGAGKVPFEVGRETTVVVSPVGKEGMVDYVGALNERYGKGIRAEDNGFVAWLQVVGDKGIASGARDETLALCGADSVVAVSGEVWDAYSHYLLAAGASQEEADKGEDDVVSAAKRVWKSEEDPKLAGFLEERAGLLKLAGEAARKPNWWVPSVSRSGLLIGALIPSLGSERGVCNALGARATLRAGKGDFAGFMEDVETMRRLGRHVAGGPTVIERLVGVAVVALADQAVAAGANGGTFSVEQLAEMRKLNDEVGDLPAMAEAVDVMERWSALDFTQRLAVKRQGVLSGRPNDLGGAFTTIEWSAVDWNIVLKRLNGAHDEIVAAMRLPVWQEERKATKAYDSKLEKMSTALHDKYGGTLWQVKDETKEAYSERVADAILSVLAPSLGRAEELYRREAAERKMVDVVIDAAMEKGLMGKWPAEMKGLPVDPYSKSGETVKYVVREKGVEVYSVGENGVDDGGVRGGGKHADDLGVGAVPEVGEK